MLHPRTVFARDGLQIADVACRHGRGRGAVYCVNPEGDLAGGKRNLSRLAANLGFADQSHLCRVVRAETGSTPFALRHALAAG